MAGKTRKQRAKPFVKWAGGKTQLLETFERFYPAALRRGEIERYVEPFVGSGAVLLHIMQKYPVKEAFIADVNPARRPGVNGRISEVTFPAVPPKRRKPRRCPVSKV